MTTTTTALLECPLCNWTQESETAKHLASNMAAAPGVANALGMPADALLSMHLHQARQRDEQAIERHLRTHTPQDWFPEFIRLRSAVDHVRLLADRQLSEDAGDKRGWVYAHDLIAVLDELGALR